MSQISDFYHNECEKIDPQCVSAEFDLKLGDINPSELTLETSWNDVTIDLEPAVKDAETVTTLHLAPEEATDKTALAYHREDGDVDCIEGDDLSRIISMQLLKDVEQSVAIADGNVYMYDEYTGKFKPFDLQAFVDATNSAITTINNQIASINAAIIEIERKLTPPENSPADVRVAFGNRNIYGDFTNSNSKAHGIYTHDPTNDLADDQYFS